MYRPVGRELDGPRLSCRPFAGQILSVGRPEGCCGVHGAATGLAVQFGFGGLLNFGMAGFMALGAYGYAISILSFGWPWWVGILVGCAAAVVTDTWKA